MFMASDFNQLPKFGPEEVNLAAVVERQVRLEGTIQHHSVVHRTGAVKRWPRCKTWHGTAYTSRAG